MPSKLLRGKAQFEVLYGKAPSYDYLRVFGCLCFVSTLKHGRDKLQPRATAGVFLGYVFGKKAYKIMDLETHKILESRDVVFHENIFLFDKDSVDKFGALFPFNSSIADDVDILPHQHVCDQPVPSPVTQESSLLPQLRRSVRVHKPSSHLQDFVCCSIAESFCTYTLTNLCIQDHECLVATAPLEDIHLSIPKPATYEEVVQHPGWQLAMEKELQDLYEKHYLGNCFSSHWKKANCV